MEISIVPVGTGGPSLSQHVARAVEVLQGQEGVSCELTSMGTIVEGDLPRLLEVARAMHEAVLEGGVARVVTTIKLDDRRDRPASSREKIEAVRRRLQGSSR